MVLLEAGDPVTDLYRRPGDWLSVHLDAEQGPDQRWRALRGEVDAPEPALSAIDQAVAAAAEADLDYGTLAVWARDEVVRAYARLTEPPDHDDARRGTLPWLGPALDWQQAAVPILVVVALDDEADLTVSVAGEPLVEHRIVVKGNGEAETQAAVATGQKVADEADEFRVAGVLLAAEPATAERVEAHLPASTRTLVHRLGLSPGAATADELAGAATREAATLVAEATAEAASRFAAARASRTAVEGVTASLAALAAREVDQLLVHDDPDDDREAWFGPGAVLASGEAEAPGPEARRARLTDVALRAAALAGAAHRLVPAGGPDLPAEGIGAILRG